MGGIIRLPAALVALVLGDAGGLFRPALGAEFALVHCAAGTGPAVRGRLGLAALGAEFSGGGGPTGADPATGGGRRRRRRWGRRWSGLLLGSHLIEVLGVHASHLPGHPHAHKGHGGAGIGIGCRRLHGTGLCAHQMGRRPAGIQEGRVALHLLDHLLVFLVGLDTGDAEGDDLDAPQVTPAGGELLIEGLGQLQGVAGERGVTDTHFRDLCECGLQGGEQLRLHLPRDLLGLKVLADVTADIGIEQHGVFQADTVLAEAADTDIQIDSRPLVHHPEGNGAGSAVLVAGELLGVEVVDPLILGGFAAEGKALADVLEHALDGFTQIAGKEAGFCGCIVGVLARLGTHIHNLALLHDEHTLAVCHRDDRAVGDDVVIPFGVAGAARDLLFSLDGQYIRRNGFAVEKFLPLVGQHAAGSSECSFDQSHSV